MRRHRGVEPAMWWWALFRLSGELIGDREDSGRHMLGWVCFYICDYFARSTVLLPRPDPDWAHLITTAERRLIREAPPSALTRSFETWRDGRWWPDWRARDRTWLPEE